MKKLSEVNAILRDRLRLVPLDLLERLEPIIEPDGVIDLARSQERTERLADVKAYFAALELKPCLAERNDRLVLVPGL